MSRAPFRQSWRAFIWGVARDITVCTVALIGAVYLLSKI